VKELREVIEEAKVQSKAILFIDEIHRFNKGQQDALLGAVEKASSRLLELPQKIHPSKSTRLC